MPRAVVLPGPHKKPELREFPRPTLEPGAATLQTLYTEVCGTDVHIHHGKLDVPFPIIPGHVSVGTVAEARGTLRDVSGNAIKEGDVVTFLDVHETCGHCYHCLVANQPNRCPSRKVYGISYSANEGLLGGWSEVIWMKPGVKLIPLPKGLDAETFIGGGCGLVTALHSVDEARIKLGESVAVLGVGPVGQSVVAFASLSGAGQVIAIDGPKDRLEYSKRMGATSTVSLDLPAPDRLAEVRRLTGGRGVDVVIEASGAPAAITDGLDMVRDGGRMIVCGHYTDNGSVQINPHWQINRKHVELRGVWGCRYEHFHRAVHLAARFGAEKPWREMVSGRFSLERAGEALAAIENRSALKAIITPNG